MAAPQIGAKPVPSTSTERKIYDGFSTQVSLAASPNVGFWMQTVKPPGIDGGDAINITTMLNTAWRTYYPRSLKTLTESDVTGAYDADLFSSIISLINVPTTVSVFFPDGDTLAFYGYLRMFEPQEHKEGEMPLANWKIQPTNYDFANGVEAAPVFASASGT